MGNAAELNQFLVEVEKRAFAMAMVSVKNRDDALDIVQDVMMALARKYAAKQPSDWPPLFFRMLKNRIADHHRSGSIRRRVMGWFSDDPDSDIEAVAASRQDQPDVQRDQSVIKQKLIGALSELPERQRQAFMLRIWAGLSVKETYDAMACGEGSVKTHLSRATAALRERLPEFSGSDDG